MNEPRWARDEKGTKEDQQRTNYAILVFTLWLLFTKLKGQRSDKQEFGYHVGAWTATGPVHGALECCKFVLDWDIVLSL